MSRLKLLLVILAIFIIYVAYTFRDDFEPERVNGVRAIVTGSSMGIGEQTAYQYARLGASVMITARSEEKLKKVVDKCRQLSNGRGNFYYLAGDMTDTTFYKRLIDTAVEKMGGLDHLILNHIFDSPVGAWVGNGENITVIEKMLDINVLSYIHLSSLARPHLERSHGTVTIISSIAGRMPQLFNVAYATTKFAINGFFSGIRHEFAYLKSNVSVTICTIGLIGTQSVVTKMTEFGLKKLLDSVPPAPADEAAMAIIKGTTMKHRDVWFPYAITRYMTLAGQLFPLSMEYVGNKIYELNR